MIWITYINNKNIQNNKKHAEYFNEFVRKLDSLIIMLSENKARDKEKDKKYLLLFEEMRDEIKNLSKDFLYTKDQIVREINDLSKESAEFHLLYNLKLEKGDKS